MYTVLDAAGKLGKIIVGMNRALGEIPVTVKLRTGVKDGRNTAHKLMPRLGAEWNVGCITVRSQHLCWLCFRINLLICSYTVAQDSNDTQS
jgi:hypothetical protein